MSIDAPKPAVMQPIDYADHTVEVDTRWMLAEHPEFKAAAARMEEENEDPRFAEDLTATQVNELLNLTK